MDTDRKHDVLPERRRKPRVYRQFPTKLQGVDCNGEAFDVDTFLDNISAGGLYVRLNRRIELGTKMSMVVRLSTAKPGETTAPNVALQGRVGRLEPLGPGLYGVAVVFTEHRFIS